MALDDVMPAKVTYIAPSRVLPVDNGIEYEAFDAVADKLLPLLGTRWKTMRTVDILLGLSIQRFVLSKYRYPEVLLTSFGHTSRS